VEGSPQAEGKKAGATVSGAKLLSLLQKVNDQIWVPEAHISFWSPISSGLPAIKDPSYTGGPGNYLGDIDALWHFESGDAREECKQAWASRYPGQTGTILINVRLLTNAGPVLGHSPGAQRELWITDQRGDDLADSRVTSLSPMLRLSMSLLWIRLTSAAAPVDTHLGCGAFLVSQLRC
jgi:hypothetical protein